MTIIQTVNVSGCAQLVEGEDAAILYALWRATKNLKRPYRIIPMPRTGDNRRFAIAQ